jgi:ABC-2 type transport system ATP-binding protein
MTNMTNNNELIIDSVAKSYGRQPALTSASLRLQKGVCTAIIGPNGSGKTTLLKLAMGLLSPDAGTVTALGHAVRPFPAALTGRLMAVIDSVEPPGWATPKDLISLYQSVAGPKFQTDHAKELITELRITPSQRYRALSKGQKRWLLNSLAIASVPEILILDEPSDGLDPLARARLYQLIRRLVDDSGSAVLFATHILAEVERAADRILLMGIGQVLFEEDLETLREEIFELELPANSAFSLISIPGAQGHLKIISRTVEQNITVVTLRAPASFNRETIKSFGWLRPFNLERFYSAISAPASPSGPADIADAQTTGTRAF